MHSTGLQKPRFVPPLAEAPSPADGASVLPPRRRCVSRRRGHGPRPVGTPPAPTVTTPVSISAVTAPDVGTPFAATPGTYTGTPVLTYHWLYADGSVVTGATAATYTPVSGDVGKRIRVVEVATNASGSVTTQSELSLVVTS